MSFTDKPEVFPAKWNHKPITLEMLNLDAILFSPYAYEQGLVKVIGEDGKQTQLNSVGEFIIAQDGNYTVKIEGIERLSRDLYVACQLAARGADHFGPVSCHCFIAKRWAPSFPFHSDPDNVLLYVVDGTKSIEAIALEHSLTVGRTLFIAAGVPHRAHNNHPSVMLSIGFEKYLSEKL
jgi:mannose-6-phosphate isomerase-like protein (cupin superfamily)